MANFREGIEKIDGGYIVRDTTDGGYINRFHSYTQEWETKWDNDLNFVSLVLNLSDLTNEIVTKDKTHEDYYKAVRAKNRHLKLLKEHLGIDYKKNEPEYVNRFYIRRNSWDYFSPISEKFIIENPKTVKINNYNEQKGAYFLAKATFEKRQLVEEYNRKLAEFKKYREDIFNQIFDEDN